METLDQTLHLPTIQHNVRSSNLVKQFLFCCSLISHYYQSSSVVLFVEKFSKTNCECHEQKLRGDLVYLVIVQDVYWVLLLLLQRPQSVL